MKVLGNINGVVLIHAGRREFVVRKGDTIIKQTPLFPIAKAAWIIAGQKKEKVSKHSTFYSVSTGVYK